MILLMSHQFPVMTLEDQEEVLEAPVVAQEAQEDLVVLQCLIVRLPTKGQQERLSEMDFVRQHGFTYVKMD